MKPEDSAQEMTKPFDVAECRAHCPTRQNSATGRWLELALVEIERLRGQSEPPVQKPAAFDLDDIAPTSTEAEIKEALALAEEIESLAGDLPAEGEDFGMSVTEKAADITANIEAHNRVTDGQINALENMLGGLRRWFPD